MAKYKTTLIRYNFGYQPALHMTHDVLIESELDLVDENPYDHIGLVFDALNRQCRWDDSYDGPGGHGWSSTMIVHPPKFEAVKEQNG